MKSYKILIVVVVVLILINCALLAAFWFKRDNWASHGGPQQRSNEYLSKELKLTPAQEKAYAEMSKQHFDFTHKLNEDNHMLRDSFFENIKTTTLNTAATD